MDRQLIGDAVSFFQVRALTVEVDPTNTVGNGVTHSLLVFTSATYPHLTPIRRTRADMTKNIFNQTFHG
jgi:hypothetical protein